MSGEDAKKVLIVIGGLVAIGAGVGIALAARKPTVPPEEVPPTEPEPGLANLSGTVIDADNEY